MKCNRSDFGCVDTAGMSECPDIGSCVDWQISKTRLMPVIIEKKKEVGLLLQKESGGYPDVLVAKGCPFDA